MTKNFILDTLPLMEKTDVSHLPPAVCVTTEDAKCIQPLQNMHPGTTKAEQISPEKIHENLLIPPKGTIIISDVKAGRAQTSPLHTPAGLSLDGTSHHKHEGSLAPMSQKRSLGLKLPRHALHENIPATVLIPPITRRNSSPEDAPNKPGDVHLD